MELTSVRVAGYRSIRDIRLPLRRITTLEGSNGVGKTNLYRALHLLQAAANGTLGAEIAGEGGLAALMWAGERRKSESPRLRLEAEFDDMSTTGEPPTTARGLGLAPRYAIEIGFPMPTAAAFAHEAIVKAETLSVENGRRRVMLMERQADKAWGRNGDGQRVLAHDQLLAGETALSALRGGFPEIDHVRETLARWRFYHGFRTDPGSPLRAPAPGAVAPLLAADGSNLAAVFATLKHIRQDSTDLDAAIDAAFPGARLDVPMPDSTVTLSMIFSDMPRRAFSARELSDGTLHFLALLGALLSYRLPPLIVLDEPEASLHPDLLPAIAKAVAVATTRAQIMVVTHSRDLADLLSKKTGTPTRRVIRQKGATWIEGLRLGGTFEGE